MIMETRNAPSLDGTNHWGFKGPRMLALESRASATRQTAKQIEEEISRLTWAVMDGWATPEDRQQLTALVEAQHRLTARGD